MAPKSNDGGKHRNITDFFKPKAFTIPKSRRPASDHIEEDIVVASLKPDQLEKRTQLAIATASTPKKAKTANRSQQSPQSSSSSEINILKRKRTSPRIAKSQSTSASPGSLNSTKSIANLSTGDAEKTPTRKVPYRQASVTPQRRAVQDGMSSSSSGSKMLLPEEMAAPPIPQPQFSRSVDGASAVASFASTSSLSTAPLSSQTSSMPISSSTSSRRVVRGGLKAVTNSDSDDSDEDLADVSSFLPKRVKLTPPVETPRSVSGPSAVPARQSTRVPEQRISQRFVKALPLSPPRTIFKNSSLAKLVAKNEERRLAQERIKAMEMDVEESKQREALAENQDDHAFNREAMLDLAADDDQREELKVALDRTEALKAVNHYHFFLDDQPKWPNSPFPVDSLPDESWCEIYLDDRGRAEACVSGMAAELAERYSLPMNVTMWFASQLMHETSEMLCEAYVEILRVSSRHHHNTSMSDTIASLTSRYHTRSLFENESRDQTNKVLPKGLQYVLRTLQFCAPASDGVVLDATPTTTCAAFLDLALLNIDVLVREDVNLSRVVANCIQDMLDALPESSFQSLMIEVLGTFFDPNELSPLIRCRAISNLPCHTLRAYNIRRRLALECFSTVTDRSTSDDQDWQASMLHILKTDPALHISEDMDYDYLMAMIAVVDIAVANGFADHNSLMPQPTPEEQCGGLMFSKPKALSAAEREHNQQIDRLVEQLQGMMSRVKDSGTSHLGRTQAKSLMEGLVVRLEACVRTRQRPRKSVFNRGITQTTFLRPASVTPAKSHFSHVMGKKVEVRKERDEVEVVPLEMLSDREASPSL